MKILVISDLHGNLRATSSVFDSIDMSKIDKIYCLGDVIDYGVNNNEVVDILLKYKDKIDIVIGNHEDSYYNQTLSFYRPKKEYSKISSSITRKLVDRKKLDELYESKNLYLIDKVSDDLQIILLHQEEMINSIKDIQSSIDTFSGKSVILVGHTHLPWARQSESYLMINPGSVGQPRDGDPRASYVLLDIDCDKIDYSFIKVRYDCKGESDDIMNKGGHQFISKRLLLGI